MRDAASAASPRGALRWDAAEATSRGHTPISSRERATRSASVVCSSTSRIAERSSSQSGWSAAAAPHVLDVLGTRAAHRRDRSLDRPDDVGDADLPGGARERVATLDPPLTRDELRVPELDQDALEELPRDRLRGRELLAFTSPPAAASSSIARRA